MRNHLHKRLEATTKHCAFAEGMLFEYLHSKFSYLRRDFKICDSTFGKLRSSKEGEFSCTYFLSNDKSIPSIAM